MFMKWNNLLSECSEYM